MRICITSKQKDLDAEVDPRFGRCPYFLFVDPETLEFEAVRNESGEASGGAGIQAAQTVARAGAEVVITGSVGPNAYRTLEAAGIRVMVDANGSIRSVVGMFRRNELREARGPSAPPHAGAGGRGD